MNTLNILAPVLLLAAVVIAAIARFGNGSNEINRLLTEYAMILTVISIFIRITWGTCLRLIRKRSK
jgi:Flp pilus assembly pilin Flp